MNIAPNNQASKIDKAQLEQVEQKEHEYALIAQYVRTRGLTMYAYSNASKEISKVSVSHKDTVHLKPTSSGLMADIAATEICEVDSRDIHFEALNIKTALRRIKKYQLGLIKDLCNLRTPNRDELSF